MGFIWYPSIFKIQCLPPAPSWPFQGLSFSASSACFRFIIPFSFYLATNMHIFLHWEVSRWVEFWMEVTGVAFRTWANVLLKNRRNSAKFEKFHMLTAVLVTFFFIWNARSAVSYQVMQLPLRVRSWVLISFCALLKKLAYNFYFHI